MIIINKSNEVIHHEVRELVGDYGVYAKYANPKPHEKLLVVCNSLKNAELIKMILDHDSLGQTCNDSVIDDILDTANGNIVGYLDDLFHAKEIDISSSGYDSLDITIKGIGRLNALNEDEMRIIHDMQITHKVDITRKLLGKILWSKLLVKL